MLLKTPLSILSDAGRIINPRIFVHRKIGTASLSFVIDRASNSDYDICSDCARIVYAFRLARAQRAKRGVESGSKTRGRRQGGPLFYRGRKANARTSIPISIAFNPLTAAAFSAFNSEKRNSFHQNETVTDSLRLFTIIVTSRLPRYIVCKPVNDFFPNSRIKFLEKLVDFGNFNAPSMEDSYSGELAGESMNKTRACEISTTRDILVIIFDFQGILPSRSNFVRKTSRNDISLGQSEIRGRNFPTRDYKFPTRRKFLKSNNKASFIPV